MRHYGITASSISAILAFPVIAATSDPTIPVTGRPPVASSVEFSPSNPEGGQDVTAVWVYSDLDNDAEQGSLIEWLRDGSVASTGKSWTVKTLGNTITLQARITPRSAPPADPAEGMPATSASVTVSPLINRFVTPGRAVRNQSQWVDYCTSIGARLPTAKELQALFLDSTSAPAIGSATSEMCTKYGWPLTDGSCGGESRYAYFSADYNVWVDMRSGLIGSSNPMNDGYGTCIR